MTTPYQTLALPVDSIQSHPENDFTMDESEMQELVASIRSEGLGQLPLVRKLPDGAYQMIAGHRRLEAYRRLAREDAAFRTIPVTLVDDLDDARARVLLNVTNLVTRRLSQEERGARYAAIGREVPALREADPSLKGVRTNDIIARIVTEERAVGCRRHGQARYRGREASARNARAGGAPHRRPERELAGGGASRGRRPAHVARHLAASEPETAGSVRRVPAPGDDPRPAESPPQSVAAQDDGRCVPRVAGGYPQRRGSSSNGSRGRAALAGAHSQAEEPGGPAVGLAGRGGGA